MAETVKNILPDISVVLPVYNGEKFLRDAIRSLLDQTFKNFELLVVNDGSTDRSLEITKSFTDKRIKLIELRKNSGLIFALNTGITQSKGKYIVRMDADDICTANRLEVQFQHMESFPELGVCGTDYDNFSETFYKTCRTIKGNEQLKAWLLFSTPLCHPSVIIRKSILPENPYDANFRHVEDYELWTRLALSCSMENLPLSLLKYRHHPAQISNEKRAEQLNRMAEIQSKYLVRLGFKFSESELLFHVRLSSGNKLDHLDQLSKAEYWFLNLIEQNKKNQSLNDSALRYCTARMFYDLCGNTTLGLRAYLHWYKSPLRQFYGLGFNYGFRQLIKCLIRNIMR